MFGSEDSCVYSGKHVFSFLLGIDLGMELLHHGIYICSIIGDSAKNFSEVVIPTYTFNSSIFQWFHILFSKRYFLYFSFWLF